jgi:transcription termination factor Rho
MKTRDACRARRPQEAEKRSPGSIGNCKHEVQRKSFCKTKKSQRVKKKEFHEKKVYEERMKGILDILSDGYGF